MTRAASAGILSVILVAGGVHAAPPPEQAAPTFTRDVAPILYKNCTSCHRAGEIGPMPLVSYQDVRPWAKSIKSKVVAARCRRGAPIRRTARSRATAA